MSASGYRERRDAAADALLARLTTEELIAGLERGRTMIAILEADQAILDRDIAEGIGHPGRHASRDFETAMQADYLSRMRHLKSAVVDCEAELARREAALKARAGQSS